MLKQKKELKKKGSKKEKQQQTNSDDYRTVFQVIIRAACIVTHNQIFSICIGFYIEVNIQTIPLHVIAIMSLRAYLSFTFLNGMSIFALYTSTYVH